MVSDGMERCHQSNWGPIDVRQHANPRRLIESFQVGPIISGQLALGAIIHDGKRLVRSEHLTRPRGLADVREEVPKSEDVADFMDESIYLLLPALGEHLGIQQ